MLNLEHVKIYNPTVYRILKNSYLKNKLSHAYIFSGNQNTEIFHAPQLLIEILISDGNLFIGDKPRSLTSYPDLQILDGQKILITKDIVKDALERFALKALDEKGVKILYIQNIENTNRQSLNGLLKFIEDPQPNTYIVMTTNNIHNVLTTIKSRALEIKVRGASKQELTKDLLALNWDKTAAQVIASFARSKKEAIHVFKNQDFNNIYEKILNVLTLAYSDPDYIVSSLSLIMTKTNYYVILSIMLAFIRDIIKIKDHLPLDNEKHHFLIEKYAHTTFDYNKSFQLINHFLIMQKHNVNFNLAKNSLLLQLETCYE